MLNPLRIGLLALIWTALQSVGGAQAIQFEPKELTLGAKFGQEIIEGIFTVKNSGSRRIAISRVDLSCGCSQYRLGESTLEPGATTKLTLLVDLGGRTGTVNVSATLRADDAESPQTVKLSVSIPEIITIQPRLLTWAKGEKPAPKRVLVKKNPAATHVSVVGVTTNDEGFEAQLVPGAPDGDVWVEITPRDTRFDHRARYTVRLNPENSTREGITIYAYIK